MTSNPSALEILQAAKKERESLSELEKIFEAQNSTESEKGNVERLRALPLHTVN